MEEYLEVIKERCSDKNYNKLIQIKNDYLYRFIAEFIEILNPASIFICNDSKEDFDYIRDKAIRDGEEIKVAIPGHTVHFDGYYDQGRDKKNTRLMVPEGVYLGSNINTIDKEKGLEEILSIMKNIMKDKELHILFFSLGPNNSRFTIPAVQLTDSSYVSHSEILLYRPGYEEFKRLGNYKNFFKFVHSAGELKDGISVNVDKRRIYMDTEDDIVYSVNTQYGGNTIGHKKLAMRLGINRASKEDWLTEHMFISGIHGPGGRVTYFTGAFPSMCGKTSTAMLEGETIVGDDIAYLRNINNSVHAVNVEIGIFGIIEDINPHDDPYIWEVLNSPDEIIFSNVLITEDKDVYWTGKSGKVPEKGINYSGEWYPGKKGPDGKEIPPSHKNARFTVNLKNFKNLDKNYDNPEGVEIKGIIYGGRDSDTMVPVLEAYDWVHGIISIGASLESETTAATLDKIGVRELNPMSNLDFLSVSVGKYIDINLKFGKSLDNPPRIFGVNYFLKDRNGNYLNERIDKKVWLKWMELRVHNEVEGIDIGIGFIPVYEDLKALFKEFIGKDYTREDYIKQFTLRIPENISKINRIIKKYRGLNSDVPDLLYDVLKEQKRRLEDLKRIRGEYISPFSF
ncbi:MAG: phosphoenolpyruvate carboxykinase (GTP) [Actinomycetota bacterium]|nr:phosphoenolpyruvate carboxykinase (GTP) [Actinomycetota bacterium]